MKLVQCIIRPEKVDEVVEALQKVCSGMTVSQARGHGRQKGKTAVYRGTEYQLTLLPKGMIEIVTPDSRVDDIVRVLFETARTGVIGDGRVFIHPVEEVYHVGSGFRDLE
jgi:nitrogen regulatory protein PII